MPLTRSNDSWTLPFNAHLIDGRLPAFVLILRLLDIYFDPSQVVRELYQKVLLKKMKWKQTLAQTPRKMQGGRRIDRPACLLHRCCLRRVTHLRLCLIAGAVLHLDLPGVCRAGGKVGDSWRIA